MEISDLWLYFPTAEKKEFPSYDAEFLSVPYEGGYLWIPGEDLTEKEKCLIDALQPLQPVNHQLEEHLWYRILFEGKEDPSAEASYRVIQMKVSAFNNENDYRKLWQDNLKEFFPSLADDFFLSDEEYILVEKQTEQSHYLEELTGIFTTLDADFDLLTQAFIGEFYASGQEFHQLFQEERKLFLEEKTSVKDKQVFQFSDVALHYFTKDKVRKSPIITYFRKKIGNEDEAFRQLVETMWKYSGNITSVSKEMYTHRNTINYRIEKIYDQTGINLKTPDDLLFCYLMLLED